MTGCGSNSNNNNNIPKVINTESNEEKLTAEDIYNIKQENSAKFKKYYILEYHKRQVKEV